MKNCLFVSTNIVTNNDKSLYNGCLMDKFHGVLAMTLLEYSVLEKVYNLILIIANIILLVLGEGCIYDINGNFGSLEKTFSI